MLIMVFCEFFSDHINYNFMQVRVSDFFFTLCTVLFGLGHLCNCDQNPLRYKDLRSAVFHKK